jgi:predicted esterase
MENNKTLYKAFTRLAIHTAMKTGVELDDARKFIYKSFNHHPYAKEIKKHASKVDYDKHQELEPLLADSVVVCEDLGPDRDYIALVLILENLTSATMRTRKVKKDKVQIVDFIVNRFREEIDRINKKIDAPPSYNALLETRGLIEWSSIFYLYPFIPKRKKGKGKPVLIMPPYLGNDFSTRFVRKYLTSLGFETYKWDLGVNTLNSKHIPNLVERLDEIYEKHQEKVSLVGWSGGGMFAKIIANRHPEKVAQLITIGSPVWGVKNMNTPLVRLLEFFRGKTLKERNATFLKELENIPKVPITCIYTKTDGLLPWKHCQEAETLRADIKNIEVFGSHIGMGANTSILFTVAHALGENLNLEPFESKFAHRIEELFFPMFWKEKGFAKFTRLLSK